MEAFINVIKKDHFVCNKINNMLVDIIGYLLIIKLN